jgi:hypothetical protein
MSQLNIVTSKSRTLQPDATVTGVVLYGGHLQITCVNSLEVGDIVSITGIVGATEANRVGIVFSATGSTFTLENSPGAVSSYISGGVIKTIGWASPLVSTDNSVIDNTADLTLKVKLTALSPDTKCRIEIEDGFGADTTAETVATFNVAGAMKNSVSDYVVSRRRYEMPNLRIGNSGCFMRAKLLFPSGIPGNSATFSAWLDAALVTA